MKKEIKFIFNERDKKLLEDTWQLLDDIFSMIYSENLNTKFDAKLNKHSIRDWFAAYDLLDTLRTRDCVDFNKVEE